ncbi:MAG: 50S ribosomal protein L15e [Candidatus Micrarchaeota archaeon]|nr:50S ribosomal protein L15e [Candidatus Micrarchaeota archaeon]
MGMYKYITKAFQEQYKERSMVLRKRITEWRKLGTVTRIERPTNISRARSLGFKAKEGFLMARVAVGRGSRKRPHPWGGRKAAKNVAYLSPGKSLQRMAEEKAGRVFSNLEVVNSYWVGQDGVKKYYEVILADRKLLPGMPHGRVFRGLTSAGKQGRQWNRPPK